MMFYVNKSIFLLDFVWRYFVYDVGKVLYKYCTSTFPISTLIIMYNMWWYIYEYHLCNFCVEIKSILFYSFILWVSSVVSPHSFSHSSYLRSLSPGMSLVALF